MTSEQRVLERVRKLLATAEHPNTDPAEAEAMSEKAAELMARYAIDAALLDDIGVGATGPARRDVAVFGPYTMPKSVLLGNVAGPFGVRTIISVESESRRVCALVGFAADIDLVELLFTSLLLQASSAMLHASAGQDRVRSFRHAFLLGYAEVIGRRIREARTRAETDAQTAAPSGVSTDIVLRNRRAEVDKAVDDLFPHLRSMRPTVSSGGGLAAGRDAARRADLSRGDRTVGSGRRVLP